jgi:hypothetical protein
MIENGKGKSERHEVALEFSGGKIVEQPVSGSPQYHPLRRPG